MDRTNVLTSNYGTGSRSGLIKFADGKKKKKKIGGIINIGRKEETPAEKTRGP